MIKNTFLSLTILLFGSSAFSSLNAMGKEINVKRKQQQPAPTTREVATTDENQPPVGAQQQQPTSKSKPGAKTQVFDVLKPTHRPAPTPAPTPTPAAKPAPAPAQPAAKTPTAPTKPTTSPIKPVKTTFAQTLPQSAGTPAAIQAALNKKAAAQAQAAAANAAVAAAKPATGAKPAAPAPTTRKPITAAQASAAADATEAKPNTASAQLNEVQTKVGFAPTPARKAPAVPKQTPAQAAPQEAPKTTKSVPTTLLSVGFVDYTDTKQSKIKAFIDGYWIILSDTSSKINGIITTTVKTTEASINAPEVCKIKPGNKVTYDLASKKTIIDTYELKKPMQAAVRLNENDKQSVLSGNIFNLK